MAFTVAVYLVNKAFGGPEEGGWWYDAGIPADEHADKTRGFATEDEADKYANELNRSDFMKGLNEGRPEISSVLSTGRYEAVSQSGNPTYFPVERPQYE